MRSNCLNCSVVIGMREYGFDNMWSILTPWGLWLNKTKFDVFLCSLKRWLRIWNRRQLNCFPNPILWTKFDLGGVFSFLKRFLTYWLPTEIGLELCGYVDVVMTLCGPSRYKAEFPNQFDALITDPRLKPLGHAYWVRRWRPKLTSDTILRVEWVFKSFWAFSKQAGGGK